MADPLSVSASVVGLISLALQTTEYLYKFYTTCRDQTSDIKRVTDQLGELLQILETIDGIIRSRQWAPDEGSVLNSIEKSISRCDEVIQELKEVAEKFRKDSSNSIGKKIVSAGRRVTYPFRRSTLEKLAEDVGDCQDNLSLALQALQLKEHHRARKDVEELLFVVKRLQAFHISDKIRAWLNAPDASIEFNLASAKRHPGTGEWFTKGSTFTSWLQKHNSFLWLYGFAGCGKSVLCSTIIQHTFRYQRTRPDSAVAFFFFTYNDSSKRDASAALRALLLQLCGQIGGLETELDRIKSLCNNGVAPLQQLMGCLKQAISRSPDTFLIIDALDECPQETYRRDVLEMLDTMRGWQLPALHMLVTSRDAPDIRAYLDGITDARQSENILLRNDGIQEDILRYITYQFDHDRQLRRWATHREKIVQYLAQHAQCVFHWVDCQLTPLRRCPKSEKHLDRCLHSLPIGLDATYERMLCEIGHELRSEASQILSLLLFSKRPLSVDEVLEATAIDVDHTQRYDPQRKLEDADDLLRICSGLIEIYDIDEWNRPKSGTRSITLDSNQGSDREKGLANVTHDGNEEFDTSEINGEDGRHESRRSLATLTNDGNEEFEISSIDSEVSSKISRSSRTERIFRYVRIAHFSIQEYLVSDRIKKGKASVFAMDSPSQHERICKICLIYLSDEDFLKQPLTSSTQSFALTRYAATYWYDHFHDIKPNPSRQLLSKLVVFLTYAPVFQRWTKLYESYTLRRHRHYFRPVGTVTSSPMYFVALLGLIDIAAEVMSLTSANINLSQGFFGTPLQAAAAGGHTAMVEFCCQVGADVNARVGYYNYALLAASCNGKVDAIRVLLRCKADMTVSDRGMSALWYASVFGHLEAVKLLLEAGADVNARCGTYGTALSGAVQSGREDIVKLLLEAGADINAGKTLYGTVLLEACHHNNLAMVKLLLENGADANCTGGIYGTALQAASFLDRQGIVELLLGAGADVNARGGKYGSALQAAQRMGHADVIELLRAHDAQEDYPNLIAMPADGVLEGEDEDDGDHGSQEDEEEESDSVSN